jgi:hypothetical protein
MALRSCLRGYASTTGTAMGVRTKPTLASSGQTAGQRSTAAPHVQDEFARLLDGERERFDASA